MRRTRPRATSARVRRARAGIEKWRKTRKKRSPMPEPLWDAAVELAQSEGVYPIARTLRVNYQSLQCRVAIASSTTRPGPGTPRGFVELSSPLPIAPPPPPAGPVLELSDGSGATLTIRLPSASELDVEHLAKAFLHRGLG